MARMIDGDKLVENLRLIATCWSVSPFVSKEKHEGAADMLREVEREVKEAPTLTPPNEWVSVEDTVPDPGERVLATDGIFVGEAYRSSANSWFRHTGFPWRDGVTGRTVRFWMPLPAPPTKEE